MALSRDDTTTSQRSIRRAGTRRGTAFLVEALFVLVLLMASIAVFVRLFSGAQLAGMHANRTSQAVIAATNCAEEFCADPQGVAPKSTQGDFVITCDVTPTKRQAGTYYEAHIVVSAEGETIYELVSARYVSGGDAS